MNKTWKRHKTTVVLKIAAECTNGDVRLVGGSSSNGGRVEFCFDEGWGTVCSGGTWDTIDAQVICRQLGFPVLGKINTYVSECVPISS